MVKSVSLNKEKPSNGTARPETDPLRAPVFRKGKLIGDVSVNWKALCQLQLKSVKKNKDEDAAHKPLKTREPNARAQKVVEEEPKEQPGEEKVKPPKQREGRKREREAESVRVQLKSVKKNKDEDAAHKPLKTREPNARAQKVVEEEPKEQPGEEKVKPPKQGVGRKREREAESVRVKLEVEKGNCSMQDGRRRPKSMSMTSDQAEGKGAGTRKAKMGRKADSTVTGDVSTCIGKCGEDVVEGVGRRRDDLVDTPKHKALGKRAKKERIESESSSGMGTGAFEVKEAGASTKEGVKGRTEDVEKPAKKVRRSKGNGENLTGESDSTAERTVGSSEPKDVQKEGTHGGKPPSVVTSKVMMEEADATESGPSVRKKKESKDVDENLKLLRDSGDVLSKKICTTVLGKRDRAVVEGSTAKKPADFWFDDVDMSDMGKGKRPRTSMLISGQDTSAGRCVALDCEMVGTGPEGCQSMLARCSVVNHHGNVIYNSFVAPMDTITDYRTRYSGVRQDDLKDAPTFKAVQKKISDLLKGRILVGHGVKHDLKALLLSHPKRDMRDTISYKPFRAVSQGKTPPLKRLAKEFLGVDIQEGEHNSIEDAQAAMRLYQNHKAQWEEYLKKREKFKGAKLPACKLGAQKQVVPSRSSVARTKTTEKCEPFNVMLQCD